MKEPSYETIGEAFVGLHTRLNEEEKRRSNREANIDFYCGLAVMTFAAGWPLLIVFARCFE